MRTRIPITIPGWRALTILAVVAAAVGLAVALLAGFQSFTDTPAARGYRGAPSPASTTPIPTPTPSAPAVARPGLVGASPRIYAADARHLLLLGGATGYQTTDGGSTWTPIPAAPSGPIVADGPAAGRLLAAGAQVWTSTTTGRSWQRVAVPAEAAAPFTALEVNPADGGVWFIQAGAALLRTRDGGASWRVGLTGLPAALGRALIRPASAPDSFLLASSGHVFLLRDNGQEVDDLGTIPGALAVSDLAPAGAGYVARTSDGHLFLGSGGTWKAVATPLSGPLAATAGHLMLADGATHLGQPGDVEISTDSGATWTKASGLPGDQSVQAVAYASDGTAVAYCFGGDLYESSDAGVSWRLASTGLRTP